jgi:hypothetical protein
MGIAPGQTAVFSVTVRGPTADVPFEAALYGVVTDGGYPMLGGADTTGPALAGPGGAASSPYVCPADAIAHDIQVSSTPRGSVQIEECVTRSGVEGAVYDTYTYVVSNIDLLDGHPLRPGAGFGIFELRSWDADVTVTAHTEPAGWTGSAHFDDWGWCTSADDTMGIAPGQTAVFSVTVRGPTADVPFEAALYGVATDGGYPMLGGADTTGPAMVGACCLSDGKCEVLAAAACAAGGGTFQGSGTTCGPVTCAETTPGQTLPDLAVTASASCVVTMGSLGDQQTVTVDAEVRNDGTATATGVKVKFDTNIGHETKTIASLAAGQSRELTVSFETTSPRTPVGWSVEADPTNAIPESNETNNMDSGTSDCTYRVE